MPVDQTIGIKMLYIFVDIKIDSLHFIESLKANLSPEGEISLVSTIQFVATLQAAAKTLREEGFTVQVNRPHHTIGDAGTMSTCQPG